MTPVASSYNVYQDELDEIRETQDFTRIDAIEKDINDDIAIYLVKAFDGEDKNELRKKVWQANRVLEAIKRKRRQRYFR